MCARKVTRRKTAERADNVRPYKPLSTLMIEREEAPVRDRSRGLFLVTEAVIWASFLFLDLFRGGMGSVPLKFGGVVLCFLFAYWRLPLGGDRLTAAALGLTVAADVFLLVLDRYYLLGVALFCAVQGC